MPADKQSCAVCVFYCSRICQVKGWPTHKSQCRAAPTASSEQSSSKTSSSAPAPSQPAYRTMDQRPSPKMNINVVGTNAGQPLNAAAFMSMFTCFPDGCSKQEAHERLIDAFRLFCDDGETLPSVLHLFQPYAWNGLNYGLYADEDPYPEFEKFISKAKPHLPSWWKEADTQIVLDMCRNHPWANIKQAVEKADINEHYGSSSCAMGMRMWTEKFSGVKIGR
ncbi:hypothetical protein JCM11641_001584 [Rhodosporidiobolus odoratus]